MTYREEFAHHWPRLLGVCLAVSFGASLYGYTASLFGPAMLAEFGWSKAEFAFAGTFTFISLIFTPIAGRLVDAHGYRLAGAVGFMAMSLGYLALSLMTGEIWQFYAIILLKNVFGVLTTSMVFSRVVVQRFNAARGFALAVPASASPMIGSLAVVAVGAILATDGWRAGYRLMALACFVAGALARLLCGRNQAQGDGEREGGHTLRRAFDWRDVAGVLRQRAAILMILGMFLVNIPQIVMSSQLGILLAEKGIGAAHIVGFVSLYPIGVMIGRFSTGLMLDVLRPHVVALVMLTLPAFGLAVLASDANVPWVLTVTILVISVAQGAEGDVGAYLASRKFGLGHYSFLYSLIFAAVGAGTSVGALLLSRSLAMSNGFSGFLVIAVGATVAGALCFFATGWCPDAEGDEGAISPAADEALPQRSA